MLTAALWGFVQGLTEFLPISSSGHLLLVPAIFNMEEPSLATTAVLHLGTLLAVVAYYRRDLSNFARRPLAQPNRRILIVLALGTIPAAVAGLTLDGPIEVIFSEPWIASICLMATGCVLLAAHLLVGGTRRLEDATTGDAAVVGIAQAISLLPGVSRSGMTITGALAQGYERREAARFAFLLGIPAIAGAGLKEGIDLARSGGFDASLLVGTVVAAITGYIAIAVLLRALNRWGLLPFAVYCLAFGALAFVLV